MYKNDIFLSKPLYLKQQLYIDKRSTRKAPEPLYLNYT